MFPKLCLTTPLEVAVSFGFVKTITKLYSILIQLHCLRYSASLCLSLPLSLSLSVVTLQCSETTFDQTVLSKEFSLWQYHFRMYLVIPYLYYSLRLKPCLTLLASIFIRKAIVICLPLQVHRHKKAPITSKLVNSTRENKSYRYDAYIRAVLEKWEYKSHPHITRTIEWKSELLKISQTFMLITVFVPFFLRMSKAS